MLLGLIIIYVYTSYQVITAIIVTSHWELSWYRSVELSINQCLQCSWKKFALKLVHFLTCCAYVRKFWVGTSFCSWCIFSCRKRKASHLWSHWWLHTQNITYIVGDLRRKVEIFVVWPSPPRHPPHACNLSHIRWAGNPAFTNLTAVRAWRPLANKKENY